MPTLSPSTVAPSELVHELKQAWRAGSPPDAAAVLREHPELLAHKSLVVDLAYEEYCLRDEAGQPPETEAFVRELPAYRSEMREVIRGHLALANHPELFDRVDIRWPDPGEAVEGLTVVRELGRGAFARAYLAVDPEAGNRPVVLKLSPPSGEANTLGPIHHDHVAGVLWARRVDGVSALCMRYVGAATLRDVITADKAATGRTVLDAIDRVGSGLPAVDAVPPVVRSWETYANAVAAVAARLAGALAYLHEKGITHGDLKPSNVLLGPGGHPYLIDFNLAGAGADDLPRVGGTLPYMAPERIRRLLHQPTGPAPADRGDVYSFGAVLFEALSGRVPFEPVDDPDPAAIARDLLERQLAGAPRLPKSIPPVLTRLVGRCLDPDPARRPSAATLRRQLDRFARRRVRAVRMLVASALILLAAAVGYEARSAEPESAPATLMVMTPVTPQTADEYMAFGVAEIERGAPGHVAAMTHLGQAFQLRPDGRTAALLGYAESRAGQHDAAVKLYHSARYQFGLREAWVCNNLARAWGHPNNEKQNLSAAIAAADEAIALDSDLRAAYLNRAMARYHRDLDKTTWMLPDPELCVVDLKRGLSHYPESMVLQFMAAEILASAGETHHAEAVACLREAVRLGRKPSSFAREPAFRKYLAGRADYKEVCATKEGPKVAVTVDPFLVRPPR
jgi:hypothetical protein